MSKRLTNFVQQVDARHVYPVALDHVDEVVAGGVVAQRDVRVVDLVLGQDGADCLQVQLGLGALEVAGLW